MSYASDQLYKGYLRRNLAKIVSKVKPCEIIVHLPCLTDHDRETIEAKRETRGKFDAMALLLDCLKRRENWPEEFIAALEECEHTTMAAEVRAEYDRLRGINNPCPPAPAPPPAANIVTAHVHPAPSAQREPDIGTAARAQPNVDVPSSPDPLPIQETVPPTIPAAPVLEVTTPAEPPQAQAETQIQAVVVPPVTPPPSPETPRASASPTPPPEPVEFITHQEPEENTEPSQIQDVPLEAATNQEVEEEIVATQEEPCETEATELLQAATIDDQSTPIPAMVDKPIKTITDLNDPITTSTMAEEIKFTTSIEEEPKLPTSFENEPIPVAIIADEPAPIVEEAIASITDLDDPLATSTMTEEPKLPTSFVSEPTPATIIVEEFAQTISFVEEDAPVTTLDDDPIATSAAVEAPPHSPSPPMTDLDHPILTPEKPPVQDTSPTTVTVRGVDPKLEETTVQPNTKIVDIVQQIEVTPSKPTEAGNDVVSNNEGLVSEDEDMCFSKPGVLLSVEPPNQNDTTLRAPTPDPDPYSGDSGRLAMSEEPPEENNINNKLEEAMSSMSTPSSLDMEDVRENVGHVEEEPSNLNLDVQTPIILQVNGETAKEVLPKNDTSLISCEVENVAEEPSIVNQETLNQEVETPLIQANEETAKEVNCILPPSDTTLISCNVVQDAEEPSIVNQEAHSTLNQEVEAPLIQANGETPKEIAPILSTPDTTLISDTSCNTVQDAEEPSIVNQEVPLSLNEEVAPLIHINDPDTPASILISDASSIVVHIEEEPSILNQEVQVPLIQVNGEKSKEITPVFSTPDNHQLNLPALGPKQPDSEETTSSLNTRYILTAAGVGACALLIAWRFKH